MKLTVLGCYAPYAPKNSACNGYLLQSAHINLMIDCGHGSFANLQQHMDFRSLHCLVVSHFHPDHYADIHAIRHAFAGAIRDGSRQDPLVVYAPKEPNQIYEEISKWSDAFVVIPIEDALERVSTLGDMKVRFFPTVHPMPTYGIKVTSSEGKVFAYTSDTAWNDEISTVCWQADLLLTEASLRNVDIAHTNMGHMTAKQAGILGQHAQAKKLVITHFWPEFNLFQLKREAEIGFGGQVELAEMGKAFDV